MHVIRPFTKTIFYMFEIVVLISLTLTTQLGGPLIVCDIFWIKTFILKVCCFDSGCI